MQAVPVVTGRQLRIEVVALHDFHAVNDDLPRFTTAFCFVHATAGHAEVHVLRIARVDDDGVHLRVVRRAVLHRAHPLAVLRVVVDVGKRLPGVTTIGTAKHSLRRGAGKPDIRFTGVARRQPEGVIDRAARLTRGHFCESRWLLRFLPRAAAVGRAHHRRREVSGLGGRQHGFAVAWIEHHRVANLAEKMRASHAPIPARSIAVQ